MLYYRSQSLHLTESRHMTKPFPEIPVLFEDDDILVINKPAGIVVNRSHTQKEGTVQDWVEERQVSGNTRHPELVSGSDLGDLFRKQNDNNTTTCLAGRQTQPLNPPSHSLDVASQPTNQLSNQSTKQPIIFGEPNELFRERSGIVHRLDKDTSGVLLIAKNPATLVALMAQFKLRQTQKKYVALVHGKMQPESGEMNLPIGRNPQNRLQFRVREDGKESLTQYRVIAFYTHLDVEKVLASLQQRDKKALDFYKNDTHKLPKNFRKAVHSYQGFSLVELSPKTGRTHQLRVHLSHVRHPIVGDKVYAGVKKRLIDGVWCSRIFLHAASLKIVHPRTKSELIFTAPLSDDLKEVMGLLVE